MKSNGSNEKIHICSKIQSKTIKYILTLLFKL